MRVWLLFVVVAAFAAPWINVPRDQADAAGMMAHLHAFFVGADLLYDDEYLALGMSPSFAFVTDGGVVSNHWPTGATWLQAPGYLLGRLASTILAGFGVGRGAAMGVVPWLGVRAWAMVVLVGWIAALGYASVRTGALRTEALGLTWCAVMGTPLFYYAAEAPLRPHLWGATVTLGFVMAWRRPSLGAPLARTVALATLAGLASAVRPQLVMLWLLVVHDAVSSPSRGSGGRASRRPARVLAAVAAFLPWPLVHVRVQWWMYGTDLWDYAGSVTHHLSHFLLSPYHGMLAWCPVLVVALFALGRSVWCRDRGAWLIALIVVAQIWIDAGMRDLEPNRVLGTRTWAGGVAFGPRKIVDVLPLFLPSSLSLMAAARARRRTRLLGALALATTVPTVSLHVAAFVAPDSTTGTVHTWASLLHVIGLVLEPEAWITAWHARSLPLAVPAVVGGLVALPLAASSLGIAAITVRQGGQWLVRALAAVVLGAAVAAHLWVAVLLMRSDAMLAENPGRMARARALMQPRHVAKVNQIPRFHALMRARLGADAVPSG